MFRQRMYIKFCAYLGKCTTGTLVMVKQAFREKSVRHIRVFEWHARFREDRKLQDRWKAKLIIFLDIKEIVHKEFVLAGQTVNSAYYGDVLRRLRENVWRLRPELWRKRTFCFITKCVISHFFFERAFLTKNNMNIMSHILLFSVSSIEAKAEGPPFWQNWDDRGGIAGGEHPHWTRLPGYI
jgi:hypothetical protein